jgi:hypothetical protein
MQGVPDIKLADIIARAVTGRVNVADLPQLEPRSMLEVRDMHRLIHSMPKVSDSVSSPKVVEQTGRTWARIRSWRELTQRERNPHADRSGLER